MLAHFFKKETISDWFDTNLKTGSNGNNLWEIISCWRGALEGGKLQQNPDGHLVKNKLIYFYQQNIFCLKWKDHLGGTKSCYRV